MKLTAIIIAKNAESSIADAITSIELADEIIVVDNGSTDRTADIAKYLKAKIINAQDKDFSKLRNLGLRQAKGEWVFYIDTDEKVTEELAENIKYQIANIKYQDFVAFKVKRKNFYLGDNAWPAIEHMERLFRKETIVGWKGKVHESPIVDGRVGELDGFLLHHTHRDLASMLEKTIEWSKIEAEERFKAGHPKMNAFRFFRVMINAFFDSYIIQGGYKIGIAGLVESIYQSFSMFITYARLWEMQQEKHR